MKTRSVLKRLFFFTAGIFFLGITSFGQITSPERQALANLEKQKWDKAKSLLVKSLGKDSINALGNYVYALYFFNPVNPAFHVDSALIYANQSLEDFAYSSLKTRERLLKVSVDSSGIVRLINKIDSAAFRHALNEHSEQGFNTFLSKYPESQFTKEVTSLRDGEAYQNALKKNTHQAFKQFLVLYPEAIQAKVALRKYDSLIYFDQTRNKTLHDFETFITAHPTTPYREVIEKEIFQIMTASGEPDSFESFIKKFPNSKSTRFAKDILFHLLLEQEDPHWSKGFLNDSLQNVITLQQRFLFPVFINKKFGLADNTGKMVIQPSVDSLSESYACGAITEDVIAADQKIIARNGAVIYQGLFTDIDDLGFGFIQLHHDSCNTILHKSGTRVLSCVNAAKILGGRYIVAKESEGWRIYTLTGLQLINEFFDDISIIEDVIVFSKNKKLRLLTVSSLARVADQQKPLFSSLYDEVKPWPDKLLWVRIQDMQGVVDQSLRNIVSMQTNLLTPFSGGIVSKTSVGKDLLDWTGKNVDSFIDVKIQEPWFATRRETGWQLLHNMNSVSSVNYDSIKFLGKYPLAYNKDSVHFFFNETLKSNFLKTIDIAILSAGSSETFVLTTQQNTKNVYDASGNKLFSYNCTALTYAGDNIFVFTSKDKKGLLSRRGEVLLPAEYDAIGAAKSGTVSLLKSMKFGAYDITSKKLIKPAYLKNVNRYSPGVLSVFKDGLLGFVDLNSKPLSTFAFNEVMYWTDSLAFVKKEGHWNLYNIYLKKDIEKNIKDIAIFYDQPDEKIAIIKQNNYGVLSSKRGMFIPANFTDIVNVGTPDEPIYFTEKHVSEASIYVVIYYDARGKTLMRHVYEEEEYERIYCSGN